MTFDTWMNWGLVIGIPSYLLFVFLFIMYRRIRDARYLPSFSTKGNGHMVFLIVGIIPFGVLGGLFLPFVLTSSILYGMGLLAIFVADKIRLLLETEDKNEQ